MVGTRKMDWIRSLLLTAVFVVPAAASDEGLTAATLVRQDSYRHFLDDMLFTHAGDNRGFGAEHDPARANIISLMEGFGLDVTLHAFPYEGDTYYNVVGTKLGTVYPNQEFIVGAHFDSVDNPGADDNASGVALVLEAARVLSAYDSDYTIRFIAFDREEQGLVGSYWYVQDHLTDDILSMISTDMVAYNTGANRVSIESGSTWLKSNLAAAVAEYGDGLGYELLPGSYGSDHYYFEQFGFDAAMYIEDWGNPFYHSSRDNVDEPDYIDYEYAVRMTRGIVGYLVDMAVVHVDLPSADYNGDGFVDEDDYNAFVSCFTDPTIPPGGMGCAFFDLDLDSDIDCSDWDLLSMLWTGPPEEPPMFWQCNLLPAAVEMAGSRCLSVIPPFHDTRSVALLVTGDPDDANSSCLSLYGQLDGTLGATPVFQTYDAWGTMIICDENLVPNTTYRVWCDYGEPGLAVLSPPTEASTTVWGDTVGPWDSEAGAWRPPDGNVDIIDIVAVLDGFSGLERAPPMHQVDLIGIGGSGPACYPDQRIDILDAVMALGGFRGDSYWDTTGCVPFCP